MLSPFRSNTMRKRHKKARRHNPKRRAHRSPVRRAKARRHNPKRRKARRHNPGLGLKSAMSKSFLVNTLASAGGFIVGIKSTKYLLQIPGLAGLNRWVGAIYVVLGGV